MMINSRYCLLLLAVLLALCLAGVAADPAAAAAAAAADPAAAAATGGAADDAAAAAAEALDAVDEIEGDWEDEAPAEPVVPVDEAAWKLLDETNFDSSIKDKNITVVFYDEFTTWKVLNPLAGELSGKWATFRVDAMVSLDLADVHAVEYLPALFLYIAGVDRPFEFIGNVSDVADIKAWLAGRYVEDEAKALEWASAMTEAEAEYDEDFEFEGEYDEEAHHGEDEHGDDEHGDDEHGDDEEHHEDVEEDPHHVYVDGEGNKIPADQQKPTDAPPKEL